MVETVMNVIPLFKEASFDNAAIRVMEEVFDRACFTLREFGQNDVVQETMAKRTIEVAKAGERDPDKLHAEALRAFAPSKSAALTERHHRPGSIHAPRPRGRFLERPNESDLYQDGR